jgi:hypothetical protein
LLPEIDTVDKFQRFCLKNPTRASKLGCLKIFCRLFATVCVLQGTGLRAMRPHLSINSRRQPFPQAAFVIYTRHPSKFGFYHPSSGLLPAGEGEKGKAAKF